MPAMQTKRSDISWWVFAGDDAMITLGLPERRSWPSHEEALDFARKEIGRGKRVVEIRGPTGRAWDERAVRRLLERL
jgi:hypothetical protein